MYDLYENIKNRRIELGMTQDELARLTGYTDRSSIAKIESGKVDLTSSKILLFADVLKVTPTELLGWKPEKAQTLTKPQTEIIEMYNRLNTEGQRKVYEYLSDLTASGRYKKESSLLA